VINSLPAIQAHESLIRGESRGSWQTMQRLALRALSLPYGAAMVLRNALYARRWLPTFRVPVPVVSVGNLTVGGTGKTPCVEYVARWYRQQELRVAILSRGYGSIGDANDEAMVLEENLPDVPHLQGADRAALARLALDELDSEVLVLDDGFQHRRLERDLDIVLIDATRPWGHGYLLPRGLLREPPSSLRRAGVIMLTRCDQVAAVDRDRLRHEVRRLAPQVSLVETVHCPLEWVNSAGRTAPLDLVRNQPVAAFCGIGNPEAFHRTLVSLHARPAAFRTYADHHRYTRGDLQQLSEWARRQPEDSLLATTQKDLVKLRLTELAGRPLWALRIGLQVESGEDILHRRLGEVVQARLSGSAIDSPG
jgi:tetraacyldisaccharide 4'-kinase